jgi:DNA-directed RNA polymerase specialized sigma54-like protein
LFYNAALNDEDMLEVLKADGYKIERRRLAWIRKQLGLCQSTCSMELEALEED